MTAYDVVKGHYAASERGDLAGMLGVLADDATWTECDGTTYAGTYTGVEAIKENVFFKIGADWSSFAANVDELFDAGDTVIALGRYAGTHRATGKSMTARFTHIWKVADGKVTSFEQVADSSLILAAES
ncbi:nuclear transport factor 2 family protein [Saccharothrix violaceirubra]|uniref:SnoaL-like domain-containing protein n=1 Tax=Saccharothrix violaceirubra TaxID=413306 RepID=A0A7W7T293_9PSEU|nr:nuclear transport factor 2 family protein [Saccharothrix violaceirubra]MBB4965243.1 hypothetical protein [Saccharothrix violaceirubra]